MLIVVLSTPTSFLVVPPLLLRCSSSYKRTPPQRVRNYSHAPQKARADTTWIRYIQDFVKRSLPQPPNPPAGCRHRPPQCQLAAAPARSLVDGLLTRG